MKLISIFGVSMGSRTVEMRSKPQQCIKFDDFRYFPDKSETWYYHDTGMMVILYFKSTVLIPDYISMVIIQRHAMQQRTIVLSSNTIKAPCY